MLLMGHLMFRPFHKSQILIMMMMMKVKKRKRKRKKKRKKRKKWSNICEKMR